MSTTTPVDIGGLIQCREGVQGGQPCLAGTRVRVSTIALDHRSGLTPAEILTDRPFLDLGRIHAALAYYFANRERVDGELDEELRLEEELAAQHPRERAPRAS